MQKNEDLKEQVRTYWNQQSCDTQVANAEKFSKEYFEEIEAFRFADQPFIHSFTQFTRYRGKKVIEVGFGAGTDFIQWLRAGAIATGIDLTQEALDHLKHRISIYDLPSPEKIMVGDAEKLVFASNSFDLGYSFGVLHHTTDTPKAISELVRVVKAGGEIKIMLYNRYSVYVVNQWIKCALVKGRPWKPLSWVLWNHMESLGTKGYTRGEIVRLLSRLPLENIQIHTEITSADYLSARAFAPLNWVNRTILRLGGFRRNWTNIKYVARANATVIEGAAPRQDSAETAYTGNPFGFFHCISAKKRRD